MTLACFKVIISSHFNESIIFPTTFSIIKGILSISQSINLQLLLKLGDAIKTLYSFNLIKF